MSYSTWLCPHLGSYLKCDKNPYNFECWYQTSRITCAPDCARRMCSVYRFCTKSDKRWLWLYYWQFQKVPSHSHTCPRLGHGSWQLIVYKNIEINEGPGYHHSILQAMPVAPFKTTLGVGPFYEREFVIWAV